MNPRQQLSDIHTAIWQLLSDGAASRHHGFHLPTLATVDASGNPEARIVVLRGVIPSERYVTCHTDARSPKIAQIEHHPAVAWVFYDPKERVQVRVTGKTQVLNPTRDPFAAELWNKAPLTSRRCYLAPNAPSDVSVEWSSNLPADMLDRIPSEEESEAGVTNFRVLKTTVLKLEYLHLAHNGHIRARFDYQDDGEFEASWLEP